ncbi:MAG TPA: hypothetical protein VG713_18070, partial [Pirellulales bacterium]|nr:hypothetical protein [Pirellulales bacterium]
LMLMNNAILRRYSMGLAERIRKECTNDESAAIERGYQLALGRDPSDRELAKSRQFIAAQQHAYQAEGRDNAELLAWGDYCQVLFCLNEFIYIR